jgi:crotonobetainyl-CoA:carnitine CoA-transferase CaiB-like acyl-CoA transferase
VTINNEVTTAAQLPPEHGQHTEEVLLELGYTWEEIGALRDSGAV